MSNGRTSLPDKTRLKFGLALLVELRIEEGLNVRRCERVLMCLPGLYIAIQSCSPMVTGLAVAHRFDKCGLLRVLTPVKVPALDH